MSSHRNKSKKCIVMLGASTGIRGGISSVVDALQSGNLFEQYGIKYIASYKGGNTWNKAAQAISAWTQFFCLLLCKRISLLHIHLASRASFWRKLMFFIPAKLMRIPVIIHLHGGEFHLFYENESSQRAKKIIEYVFNRADYVIVLSNKWKDWVERTFPQANVQVVYNPALTKKVKKPSSKNNNTLLFLGNIAEHKGVYDLLEAVALLLPNHPEIILMLGGEGEITKVLSKAEQLGIKSNVVAPGWVSGNEKERLLNTSSLYVLPSYNEGLPMSILEAMTHSLPIVSTKVGGIPDAVTDTKEGFLIDPGDIPALAERISQLLNNASLREEMGITARKKVESTFDSNHIEQQLGNIYKRLGIQPEPIVS